MTDLERVKRYQARHPERVKEQRKQYREKNKEKISQYNSEYWVKNKDHLREKIVCSCGRMIVRKNIGQHKRSHLHTK